MVVATANHHNTMQKSRLPIASLHPNHKIIFPFAPHGNLATSLQFSQHQSHHDARNCERTEHRQILIVAESSSLQPPCCRSKPIRNHAALIAICTRAALSDMPLGGFGTQLARHPHRRESRLRCCTRITSATRFTNQHPAARAIGTGRKLLRKPSPKPEVALPLPM